MIAVDVVNSGVTPVEMLMFGETAPLYSSFPAPLDAVPTPKCVAVSVPPDASGNVIAAAGATELFVTVQPDPDRATATRAYDVYAHSFVSCVPASPGSPVCSDTYKFVSGPDAALSAMFVIAVAVKISFSKSFSKVFDFDISQPHEIANGTETNNIINNLADAFENGRSYGRGLELDRGPLGGWPGGLGADSAQASLVLECHMSNIKHLADALDHGLWSDHIVNNGYF